LPMRNSNSCGTRIKVRSTRRSEIAY